jgi:hypothetical protein
MIYPPAWILYVIQSDVYGCTDAQVLSLYLHRTLHV